MATVAKGKWELRVVIGIYTKGHGMIVCLPGQRLMMSERYYRSLVNGHG